ncbi:hypothetical protein ACFV14_10790 [Streptomyces zaomyceticus]|uniref:hypothetical protein n=1 Tax=Streptomyces zaomyceticus TaxID=68286 RepID=UPI00369B0DDA
MTETTQTVFPPLHRYALAHACSHCQAPVGVECDAPRKARHENPLWRLHRARQNAGAAHYRRDVERAPWVEDRIPGQRYDTLGGAS